MTCDISKIYKDQITKIRLQRSDYKVSEGLRNFSPGFLFNEIYDISFEKLVHLQIREMIKPNVSLDCVLYVVFREKIIKKRVII